MPFVSSRSKLNLSKDDRRELERISKSRTEPKNKIERANILLLYADQQTVSEIARKLNTNRPKIERSIDKALEFGSLTSLADLPRAGSPGKITSEAKAWLISLACQKPKDIGLASEFWTMNELARYAREHCKDGGHESLIKIRKGTVSKILSKSDVKPHKMSYYTVRKDPDFDKKMIQVLHIYKEVKLLLSAQEKDSMVAYLSYDEKPGMQAIENIAPDLPPVLDEHNNWKRDREYKRHGTLSLLAGIDLTSGKVYGKVYDRHRSREFVEFLKSINQIYPKNIKIKMILDNHSSHISKETRSYLKTIPGRFEFIFTPTHASWLNIIEMFFSKMARSFLRGIRVSSKSELKQRILQYLDEVNSIPTIFRWKWKMDKISIVRQMNY